MRLHEQQTIAQETLTIAGYNMPSDVWFWVGAVVGIVTALAFIGYLAVNLRK